VRVRAARRGCVLATVAAALSFIGACGGESKPDSLLDVLRSFNAALASGDGKRACELLSDQRREQVVANANAGGGKRDCAELLTSLSKPDNIESRAVKSLSSAQLGSVTYAGNIATVQVTTGEFGTGIAQLERQKNGEWRVIESAAATGFF
jgi:hypothetical protein